MNNFLAVIAVVLSVLVIYTVHNDRVRKVEQEAAALAEANARSRSDALKSKKPTPAPNKPTAVAISRLLEPTVVDLFSPLDPEYPADLVPPLQITKERILDKKQHAVAAKQAVYETGIRTLDSLIAVAEERTAMLDAVLRIHARPASSLDAPNSGTSSKGFFLQTSVKRWEAGKAQRKATVDRAMTDLRAAEREWNKAAGEKAWVEDYDVTSLPRVYVKVDSTDASANPLERRAYDQRRSYSWRRSYYNQYGAGYSMSY